MKNSRTSDRCFRYRCSKRRERRGAALVEFAIVAPILMLILIGMIEFGRAMAVQQNVTTAAREAAREATLLGATVDSVEEVAEEYVSQVPAGEISVDITPTLDTIECGDLVTVSVSVPLSAISKLGSTWFGDEITISASAVMRKEGYE
jgi:Flp pilus assembly protein TadG